MGTQFSDVVHAAFAMTARSLQDPSLRLVGFEACDRDGEPVDVFSPHAVRRDASGWFRHHAHLLGISDEEIKHALYELRVQLAYFGIGQEFFRSHPRLGACLLPPISAVNDSAYGDGPSHLATLCLKLAQKA